jgi:uncharacterized membrane protein YqaE (UPF0057 family)
MHDGAMLMKFPNGWWWVELIAGLLTPGDRETVLGDLAEAGEGNRQALLAVGGLVIRRQLSVWRSWRPWLAAFGLAMPASFLLMGFSLSVTQSYHSVIGDTVAQATGFKVGPGFTMLLCDIGLLAAWSWTGGFAVGAISRRTTWMSGALSLLACTFCLARFRIDSLSRLCLLLFLPPAAVGLRFGLRTARIRFGAALAVAIAITALTIPQWSKPGAWLPNWALSWPAWYLVAIALRHKAPLRRVMHGK